MTLREIENQAIKLAKVHIARLGGKTSDSYWDRDEVRLHVNEGLRRFKERTKLMPSLKHFSANFLTGYSYYLPDNIQEVRAIYYNGRELTVRYSYEMEDMFGPAWRREVGYRPTVAVIDSEFAVEGLDPTIASALHTVQPSGRILIRLFPIPYWANELGDEAVEEAPNYTLEEKTQIVKDYFVYNFGKYLEDPSDELTDIVNNTLLNQDGFITVSYIGTEELVEPDDVPDIPASAHIALANYAAAMLLQTTAVFREAHMSNIYLNNFNDFCSTFKIQKITGKNYRFKVHRKHRGF